MNKLYYFSLLAIAPLKLIAQPTITNAENFKSGLSVTYINCNYINPGPSGASQTWNFSTSLTRADTILMQVYIPVGSPTIPGSNLVKRFSDSTSNFIASSSSGSSLIGTIDSTASGAGQQIQYNPGQLSVVLPLTYNKYDSQSYTAAYTLQGQIVAGRGTSSVKVDAYGTLVLPNNTYSNTMRVVATTFEADSVKPPGPATGTISISTIAYKWYDAAHREVLLEIDSSHITSSSGGNFNFSNAQYLGTENTAVTNLNFAHVKFNAVLSDNNLLIIGNMTDNKQYNTTVYNIAGQKIYTTDFTANGQSKQFSTGMDVSSGIYIVVLKDLSTLQQSMVKVVKQ